MSYAFRARPANTRTSSASKSRRSNSESPKSPISAQSMPEDDWKNNGPDYAPEKKRKRSVGKGEDKEPLEKRSRMEMTIEQPATTPATPTTPDFVPLATPTLDQILFNLSDTLREMRMEATPSRSTHYVRLPDTDVPTDTQLQHQSQALIDVSILHLPTHAHRSALCLTLNRFSAFCASLAVDIPAFPITATKVSLFLARSASTETARRLLQLLPQSTTFEIPILEREEAIARGEDQGESSLGIDEGFTVTMELVRSWTEALAYAEGSTKSIWGPILRSSGANMLDDTLIGELLGLFESETAINNRRRRSGAVRDRGAVMKDAAVSTKMVRSADEIAASSLRDRQGSLPGNLSSGQGYARQTSSSSMLSQSPTRATTHSQPAPTEQFFARPQVPHRSPSLDQRTTTGPVQTSPFSRANQSVLPSRTSTSSGLPAYATPRTLPGYDLAARHLPPISLASTVQRTTSDPHGFILGEGHGLESIEGMRSHSRTQSNAARIEGGGDGEKLSQLARVAALGENTDLEQGSLDSAGMFALDPQLEGAGSSQYQQGGSSFAEPTWSSNFDSGNRLDSSSQSFYSSSIPTTATRSPYNTLSRPHVPPHLSIVPPTNYRNTDSRGQLSAGSPQISKGNISRAIDSPRSTISPGMPMANEEYFLSQLSGMSYDRRGQPQYMQPPTSRGHMGGGDGGGNGLGESNYQEAQFDNTPRSNYLSHSTNHPPFASPALRPSTGSTHYPPTPNSTSDFDYSDSNPFSAASSHHRQHHQQQPSSSQQASQFHQQTSYGGAMGSPHLAPQAPYYQQPLSDRNEIHDNSMDYGGAGGGGMGAYGGGGFHSGQRSFSLPVSSTGRSYLEDQRSPFALVHPTSSQQQQQQQQQTNRYSASQLENNPIDYSQLPTHVVGDSSLHSHPLLDDGTTYATQQGQPTVGGGSLEDLSGGQGALMGNEQVQGVGLGIDLGGAALENGGNGGGKNGLDGGGDAGGEKT